MIDFKGSHFEKEMILWGVRWYVASPISYRQLEEMMGERGVAVDHSTLNRWVIKYAPEFEKQFRRLQCPVGRSWRMDETYVKIKGKWAYLYRAVDKEGHTIDFLLTPTRDRDAAEAFLRKAIRTQGLAEKITIDKGSSLICVHPTRSARAQNKAEGGGNEMAPHQDTQTRSRLSIGEDGPSDSALAAARDGRLRRPAAERHAARCASQVLCSGGAPWRYSPSRVKSATTPLPS